MTASSVIHDTFVLERRFAQAPDRVFAAFADPARKRRWFADGLDHEVVAFELDFRPGGAERVTYRMGAKTPFPGVELASEGRHMEITPGRRVVTSAVMSLGGRPISAALVTVQIEADGAGTALTLTHQAAFFEGADGPEMRKGGWVALLDRLGASLETVGAA